MNSLSYRVQNLIRKTPEYLFYLFVFLLPCQTRWIFRDYQIGGEVFEYGRMSLYGFDIILMALLLYCFIVKREKLEIRYHPPKADPPLVEKSEIRRRSILIFLCFYILLVLILGAHEKIISLYWLGRFLLGAGLFWVIQKIYFSKLRLGIVVVVSGFIQGLLAGYQFVNQAVWANKWLGMASQKAGDLGASVVEIGGERWLRAYGSLPHPNILGGFLVLVFGAWCYLLIKAKDKYQKRFVGLAGLFIVGGIFLSFSRGAWLIFFVLYLGGWWCWIKIREEIFFKKIWLGIGVAVAIMVIFFSPLVGARLGVGENERLEDKSKIERLSGYGQAWGLIKNNIWGVGIGNYTFIAKDFYRIENSWEVQPVHNVYLMIWAELGVIGFIFAILFNCYIAKLLIKGRKWPYLGILLVVYSLMLFDHFWWTTATGMYILWLITGLAIEEIS